MVYQSHILPPFACFGVCTHTGRDRCAHRFHDTHAPPPPPPPPRRARCIIDVRPACKRVAERRCHSIRSRFSKRQGEERGGGREFGASMTFIGWKRFREPSRLTYFLVNKTGVRREKRAELAEDTLLGAITTAISETNRI